MMKTFTKSPTKWIVIVTLEFVLIYGLFYLLAAYVAE